MRLIRPSIGHTLTIVNESSGRGREVATLTIIDTVSTLPDRLKLLGDPTRFKILEFLANPSEDCCGRGDGVCGCDIEAFTGLSQPTVSHHMKQLVDAGMVRSERRGRWVYYQLDADALLRMSAALAQLAQTTGVRTESRAPNAP